MNEMNVEKSWNEICGGGKREKPQKKPTQSLFRPPRNPHGATEMRIRNSSGGRRTINRLHRRAAQENCRHHYLSSPIWTSASPRNFFQSSLFLAIINHPLIPSFSDLPKLHPERSAPSIAALDVPHS